MAETESELRYVRFGAFEADLRTGELRRNGSKLKISGQPFQILAILLERPGELVTREELENRVWPDTIVDVERNLNTAIAKVREVLGDVTDRPRFIETLPRRGYRFIADVTTFSEIDPVLLDRRQEGPKEPAVANIAQYSLGKQEDNSKGRQTVAFRWLAFPGILVIGIAAGWYLLRPLPAPHIVAHRQITHDGRYKQLIGTDGVRLFFNRDLGAIAQVSVAGGESQQIPVQLDHVTALTDISQDGSNLLVSTHQNGYHPDGQLWVVNIFGGSIHRLPDGWGGTFSPDGNFVAFSTVAPGEVSVVRSDGTGARRLASIGKPSLGRSIAWSPDGRTIRAFTWDGRLWELSVDGSNAHELDVRWPPSSFRCCGRWTPDGRFFLFLNGTSLSFFPQPEIWAIDEQHRLFRHSSSDPIQLTSGPMEWGSPIPSPDGKTIYADAGTSRGELSRLDSKSGQFEPFLGGISAQGLSFSPNGSSVAYVSLPEGILWKADRDGSHPLQLSKPGMDVWMPRWSPDASQILFYNREGYGMGGGHMYIVSVAGGTPRRVIPEDAFREFDPSWSPDGQKIVFASRSERKDEHDPWAGWALRILDLKSNHVTTLPGSADSYSPRWSPDGRYIAALSTDSLELKIFDRRTQRWSLIKAKEDFAFPEWSSDSRWIYFTRPASPPVTGPTGLFRIHPVGGEPERVVDLTHFHVIGWFDTWFTLDPTGAPLIVRDVGTHDLYGLTLEVK
jgi:DNA-binding winged helix-turn-helix (wHTH) protein/Tol biopolymer transport system component